MLVRMISTVLLLTLGDTGDKTAPQRRKRVGEAEATLYKHRDPGLGTKVPNALEKYILGEEWDNFGTNVVFN